jgi:hypothetical protein
LEAASGSLEGLEDVPLHREEVELRGTVVLGNVDDPATVGRESHRGTADASQKDGHGKLELLLRWQRGIRCWSEKPQHPRGEKGKNRNCNTSH